MSEHVTMCQMRCQIEYSSSNMSASGYLIISGRGSHFLQSLASMSPLNSFREAGGPAKPDAAAGTGGAGASTSAASMGSKVMTSAPLAL